jgi:alkylation response protein AidB-like acyl-CoA dehydrogenase
MIADMVIETESARLLVYKAWDLLKKGANCLKEASMVKAYAPEVAIRVTSKGIEIHGAYGISQEYSLERYFRDARSLTAPDGTTGIHKLIVGREVLGMAAFV